MEGDFSWLWRNEELSDFTLCIREVPHSLEHASPEAEAAADGLEAGIQTRSGKRRRVNASAAANTAAAGPSTRGRAAQQQQQQQLPPPAAAAGPSTQQQQQQQVDQPPQQQADALGRQLQEAGMQQARGRTTRRSSRQQQQLQQQEPEQQQQQQRQQQDGDGRDPAAAAAAAGTPVGRRTRRSSAHHNAQQQEQGGAAAAAAEDSAPDQLPGHAAAAAGAAGQQDAAAAAAGGGSGVLSAPPSTRKTRITRGKKRGAETGAAAAAAAAAAGGGGPNARTRAIQQQQQQDQEQQGQQQEQQQQQQDQQRQSSDGGGGPPARRSIRRQQVMQQLHDLSMQDLLPAADPGDHLQEQQQAAAGGTNHQQQQQQQQEQTYVQQLVAPAAAAGSAGADNTAAAGAAAAPAAVEIRVPVHAVVLAGFSEYFKALICSWSNNLNRQLTLDVGVDEGNAALLMVEFMYTGKLPDASPEELLKMIRLADQYQVTRFMAAASSCFESLPLSAITQGVMLEVFRLPQLMLDAPEVSRVLAKARSKLLDLYGDLEKVWSCEALREQFLALPYPAVRCLLDSSLTAVATENTALVALTGWVEEGPHGRSMTSAQRKELLSLVRLPYLTSSFVGDILLAVPWIRDALDNRQLLNAFQFAIASESTRQRLAQYDYGPSSVTPHFRCPRPTSSVSRATFEWSIELSTIKRMVADAKLWGRVVELSSPLHYFAGFWWQLLFNVEKTPTPPDAPPDVAAAASGTVVEFVGVRCHVNCGAHDYWPRVVRFKATIAALQTGFWEVDYAYLKGIEGPIVDGVGLGYPGFFALPGQALENETAWSRFVRNGRVQLRCEVTDCE